MTPLQKLAEQLRLTGTRYNSGVEAAPAVVVWTDPEREWAPVLPALMAELPELFELGEYDPQNRRGPVIWLKTVLAGAVPEYPRVTGKTPIFYLPGVSRHELRHTDQCRAEIQPLCELLYSGAPWSQVNGKDWTVEAFFVAENGLSLDLAQDKQTRQSLHSALATLITTPMDRLANKRVQAGDLDSLVVSDTPRDLLMWIGEGEERQKAWTPQYWQAFRSRCLDEYGFDPDKKAPVEIARELGQQPSDKWKNLWIRFKESPGHYKGLREQLERAKPTDELLLDSEPWPQENAAKEGELRKAFLGCTERPPEDVRESLKILENSHSLRRKWVWAGQGEAPLVKALEHLDTLAKITQITPDFQTLQDMVDWYAATGNKADGAVLKALANAHTTADKNAVSAVARHIYLPWLDENARNFETLATESAYPRPAGYEIQEGECLVFVDGLRQDTGRRLEEILIDADYVVNFSTRLAALPTVTATAKPAIPDLGDEITGQSIPASFAPETTEGKELNFGRFHKILKARKIQILKADSAQPESPGARGWSEIGKIDKRGHELQEDLAKQIEPELRSVCEWVNTLFQSGWRKVTLVTDHGWLLVPGGLPKSELPAFLTESRWSRCAVIKGASVPQTPVVPWHWNASEHVAIAPGATSFKAGLAYSHGGMSPQECVLPVITVTSLHDFTPPGAAVKITAVSWKRQRCRLEVENVTPGLIAELRTTPADPKSVISTRKEIEADGECSLLVANEDLLGDTTRIVILSPDGAVLTTLATRVGG